MGQCPHVSLLQGQTPELAMSSNFPSLLLAQERHRIVLCLALSRHHSQHFDEGV